MSSALQDTNQANLQGAKNFVMQVETLGRGGAAVLIGGIMLSLLLAGMALMRAEASADRAALAEREARVSQERWNDLKVELARRGVPVSDH